jgi:hypothetical protein
VFWYSGRAFEGKRFFDAEFCDFNRWYDVFSSVPRALRNFNYRFSYDANGSSPEFAVTLCGLHSAPLKN